MDKTDGNPDKCRERSVKTSSNIYYGMMYHMYVYEFACQWIKQLKLCISLSSLGSHWNHTIIFYEESSQLEQKILWYQATHAIYTSSHNQKMMVMSYAQCQEVSQTLHWLWPAVI